MNVAPKAGVCRNAWAHRHNHIKSGINHHFIALFQYQVPNTQWVFYLMFWSISLLAYQTSAREACNLRISTLRVRNCARIHYITDFMFAHVLCVSHQWNLDWQPYTRLQSESTKRFNMVQVSNMLAHFSLNYTWHFNPLDGKKQKPHPMMPL